MENNVRHFRLQKGFTLERLGNLVGCGRSQIWVVENATKTPRLDTAYAISSALGEDIKDVFPDPNKYEQITTRISNKKRKKNAK